MTHFFKTPRFGRSILFPIEHSGSIRSHPLRSQDSHLVFHPGSSVPMSRSSALSICLCSAIALVGASRQSIAQGPPTANAAREAMAKLSKMVGKWEGEATVQLGPGQTHKVKQTEHVQSKLGGNVLLVEGLGKEKGADGVEKVVFQAMAICAYDAKDKTYKFHAFRDNGMSTIANAEVTDSGMIWGFEDGRGGKIRYTITLTDDTWTEIGEYLMEGQPARKFFDMTVKRVAEAK
jgi:hypothetical protein